MCGFYASAMLGVYLHSPQLLLRLKTNGKFGKCEVKTVVK